MKLVMTLLVRDEQDILEENIEYHLSQGVDYIIATDNLSQDNTTNILKKYESKGLLHYIFEPEDDYSQYKWVTKMARMARSDFHADWVINNDADEFWWPETQVSLKDYLQTIPPEVLALDVPRSNFPVFQNNQGTEGAFYHSQTLRDKHSVNALGYPLPSKCCHRGLHQIEVAQGNHSVSIDGSPIAASLASITIFHFPLRTFEQFQNKIRLGGAAYSRNTELSPSIGRTWRDLYSKYQAGELFSEFEAQALTEVQRAQGMASGRFVEDLRLYDWISRRNQIAASIRSN